MKNTPIPTFSVPLLLLGLFLISGCNAGLYYKPSVHSFRQELIPTDTLSLTLSGVDLWISSQEKPASLLIQTPKKNRSERTISGNKFHQRISVQSRAKEHDRMEINIPFSTVLNLKVTDSIINAGTLSSPLHITSQNSTLRLKDLSHSFSVVSSDSSALFFSVLDKELKGHVSGDFSSIQYIKQALSDSLISTPSSTIIKGNRYHIELNIPEGSLETKDVGTIW